MTHYQWPAPHTDGEVSSKGANTPGTSTLQLISNAKGGRAEVPAEGCTLWGGCSEAAVPRAQLLGTTAGSQLVCGSDNPLAVWL